MPRLTYGIEPRPGSVVYRPQPNGSLEIEVVPRTVGQILPVAAWCAVFALLPVGVAAWLFLRGGDFLPLVIGSVVIMLGLPLLLWFLFLAGRHRLHIAASPSALRIWTTQFGDAIRHDWPREQIADVRIDRLPSREEADPIGLSVHLRGRAEPVLIAVHRRPEVLEEMARRIREAMTTKAET